MPPENPRVSSPTRFEPAPFRPVEIGRRFAFFLVAIAISFGLGFALVRFPPLVIAGGLVALAGALIIVFHPFVGLLLYLLMFILRPGEVYPILGALHLERVIGMVTLIALFLAGFQRRGGIYLDAGPQTRALLVFLGAIVLSIPFSYWRGGSVTTLVDMLKILSLYIMVVHLVDTPKRLRVFVWGYILLVVYLDATSLVNYYSGKGAFAQGIDRATGATSAAGNANELGTTLACTFPLLLVLALRDTALWRRVAAGGFALAAVWGMILTGSRASLLGFLGGLVYLWWRSGRRLLLGSVGVVVILAAYFAMPDQYQGRYQTIGKSHLDESSRARVVTWLTGLEMVVDRPLFGVGAGCFGVARAMAYSPESHRSWLESHSLYIQVITELGIVGAIAFFAFVVQFLRLNRRVARKLKDLGGAWRFERAVILGVFAGFMVLLVSGVFGHSLYRRTWYLYAGLGLAMWRMLHDPRFAPAVESAPRAAAPAAGNPRP